MPPPPPFLRDVRELLLTTLLLAVTGCVAVKRAQEPSAPAPLSAAALDAPLDPSNLDRERLARAIFHETNRVRGQLDLRAFQWLPKLDQAADLEAAVGKVYQPPGHTNPFPLIGTPLERVKLAS